METTTETTTPASESTLRIENMGFGGVGIARDRDGVVCFVDRALPGELVRATLTRHKHRYRRYTIQEILEPSPLRRQPLCQYYGRCGGCHFQHLDYKDQLVMKEQQLYDQCRHQQPDLVSLWRPIIGAPQPFGYRNKHLLHYDVRQNRIGFVDPIREEIVDIDSCVLAPERSNTMLQEIRRWLHEEGTPLSSYLIDVLIRESHSSNAMMILFVVDRSMQATSTLRTLIMEGPLAHLMERCSHASIYINYKTRGEKRSFGETFEHICGPHTIRESIGGLTLELSPSAFIQVNPLQADILYDHALACLELTADDVVLDLYAGSGGLGLLAAQRGGSVLSIELDRHAVANAQTNATLNGLANIEHRVGKCERICKRLIAEGRNFSKATLNPPRKGLDASLPAQLAKLGIGELVYVSCSPPTFMRDLTRLQEAGFELRSLQPFDMFPQTYHLELLCHFRKVGA